jgi:dihydrofolate reductase
MISIIVATDQNGVIGKTGAIPWYLPADLAHFKQTTMGHPIIMGRVTHESIGKALPGRTNIVITHSGSYQADDCTVVSSLEEALKLTEDQPEVFIIGGDSIYKIALKVTDRIYLTDIHTSVEGDKFFKYDPSSWNETDREKHLADDKNPYDYDFVVLERAN